MPKSNAPNDVLDHELVETSIYWQAGGHPNFLLSVDERVIGARERLAQVADTSLTVLLWGERGVGKEAIARGIHRMSGRRDRPFVYLNAYAVPRGAIARELFNSGLGGKLYEVDDGTIYIHGIELIVDDMRLRLAEWKRERSRDGGPEPRFILSCEEPSLPREEVEAFDRMWAKSGGAVQIEIPPLRERPEDVPLLANHILQKYNEFYGSKIRTLRSTFVGFLQGYSWPGNTRELERVVRRFLVIEDEDTIRRELGSKQKTTVEGVDEELMLSQGAKLQDVVAVVVAKVERRVIERALDSAKWNKKRAAADLRISYKSLLNKIKLYEIED